MKDNPEFKELIVDEIKLIEEEITKLEELTLFSDTYAQANCYIEIHSGAGGTEACDWASMLYDMYQKFAIQNNMTCEELDLTKGDEAGVKSVSFKINGDKAYGLLKFENGIHRLVRISPFDAGKRRHTSFASVNVIPDIDSDIDIEIKEEDLKIDVYHSSGAGGQSVNTSNSAVRITHLPTKIVVACQNERSQLKNKEKALQILKNKLYVYELEKKKKQKEEFADTTIAINFGSQIRSYVMEPYKLVKDHRTNYESHEPEKILNGYIKEMLLYNLKELKK